MNRQAVLRILQLSQMLVTAFLVIGCIIVIVFDDDGSQLATYVGAIIGGIIGCIYSVYKYIPKKYGSKDERTLFIEVLAELSAVLVSFGVAGMLLLIIGSGVVTVSTVSVLVIILALLAFEEILTAIFRRVMNNLC